MIHEEDASQDATRAWRLDRPMELEDQEERKEKKEKKQKGRKRERERKRKRRKERKKRKRKERKKDGRAGGGPSWASAPSSVASLGNHHVHDGNLSILTDPRPHTHATPTHTGPGDWGRHPCYTARG